MAHPDDLLAIEGTALIGQDDLRIAALHKNARAEMTANLAGEAGIPAKLEYLRHLLRQFGENNAMPVSVEATDATDAADPVEDVAALRLLLVQMAVKHAESIVLANIAKINACFHIHSLCIAVKETTGHFCALHRIRLGKAYVIATNADHFVDDVLREIERQLQLFEADAPSSPGAPPLAQLREQATGSDAPALPIPRDGPSAQPWDVGPFAARGRIWRRCLH